jgi:hypothetical protein
MPSLTPIKTLTSIDGAEGEPKQAVVVLILLELGTDGLRKLNSLPGYGRATDVDSVSVDIATGARPVSVRNAPAGATQFL